MRTNDGADSGRKDLFKRVHLASMNRHDRGQTWSARMAFLAPLLFCAGLGTVHAGQKALLIGVGEYPYLEPKDQLTGPSNDVREMNRFLVEEWGFSDSDVRILEDAEATKRRMLDALWDWLPRATQPGDRVVIYFSGHGARFDDTSGDEEDGMDEALLPADYRRNGDRVEDSLLDDELADSLELLGDRQVLLIADSCFSGTVTKSLNFGTSNVKSRYYHVGGATKDLVRKEEPISDDLDIHLTISAALPHQLAWESGGTGVFTTLFIEALTDMRADLDGSGVLTTAELINFIKPRTEGWCEGVKDCRDKGQGFTPNIDPKNETFVLQPVAKYGAPIVLDGAGGISDILPELEADTIDIAIRPWRRLRIGDEVSIEVTSRNDGYLTLLDLNAKDELTLLFPTRADLEHGITGEIRAEQPLTVPDESHAFTFEVRPPTGPGQAIAIVTRDRVDFDSVLDEYRGFKPVMDELDFMKSIAARLYAVWTDDEVNRAARWAAAYAEYSITTE